MNDVQKLAYLQALGVDTYVSRSDLPAALPSRRLALVRPAAATERPANGLEAMRQETAEPVAHGTGVDAREQLRRAVTPAAPVANRSPAVIRATDTAAAGPTASAETPVFSLVATYMAGWYWLDELPPGREAGAVYLQLLNAICHAAGMAAPDAPQIEQFNWPLNTGNRLDRSVESAANGVRGFVLGRLERFQPRGVVMMLEPDTPWFDAAVLGDLPVVELCSAWQMLRRPALKREAWRVLTEIAPGFG